jgi:antitoxin component YwqK of YwqJK toxin-antitoxin module
VQKVWIGDTSQVWRDIYDGDTIYKFRNRKIDYNYVAYYDQRFNIPAAHGILKGKTRIDTNWYQNGQLKMVTHDLPDTCIDCWNQFEWFRNGDVKARQTCDWDSCIRYTYYASGGIHTVTKYFVNPAHGRTVNWCYDLEYYENGQPKYDPYNPNGPLQTGNAYYEDGSKKQTSTICAYSYYGDYIQWYPTGLLKVKGQYSPAEVYPNKSNKIGTWSYYSESGKLIKEEFYEEGKLVRAVEY